VVVVEVVELALSTAAGIAISPCPQVTLAVGTYPQQSYPGTKSFIPYHHLSPSRTRRETQTNILPALILAHTLRSDVEKKYITPYSVAKPFDASLAG